MPRCLRLHKVPATVSFCAVCGTRVLPGWVWLCLCAFPLALIFSAAVRRPVHLLPMATPSPMATSTSTRTFIPTSTRTARPIVPPTEIFTPTCTWRPTHTPTPTPSPYLTASATPTVRLYPRVALLSFHGRYVIAKGEADGWILRQETARDDPCAWFTLSPQTDGSIALLTCNNRYITAPETGIDRSDWLLRQELGLSECGLFNVHDLRNGEFAFETCSGTYFTAGDAGWDPDLQWTVVAETKVLLDWEKFRLEAP